MLRIGQKVVCIKRDDWRRGGAFGDEVFPSFGSVYTIRALESASNYDWLRLFEIVNPLHDYRGDGSLIEACFRSDRFRPLDKRKTDISILTKMLKPADEKVDA